MLSNAILIALKLGAAALTGSVAILSAALHSSIDLVASAIALVSVRMAAKPPDALHRYGHARIENLTAAVEGLLILSGAGVIILEAVPRLTSKVAPQRVGVGVAVLGVSAAANLVVSRYLARSARSSGSAAVAGNATHVRTDVFTSSAVVAGLVLVQVTGQPWVDPVIGLGVAAGILVSGVRLMRRAAGVLVDEALPEEELETIREVLGGARGAEVSGYHKLRTRRSGARRQIDLHLQFRAGTSLAAAHASAHLTQAALEDRLGNLDAVIHLEPEQTSEAEQCE